MTIETKTLEVIGEQTMHCSGCEQTVQFAFKQLPGTQQVEASHKTQSINLTLNTGDLNRSECGSIEVTDWSIHAE